jgi:non-heme chloroperoxidase
VKPAYDCIKAFSETDFTEDLKAIDVPVLVVHGSEDQIVPIGASAHESVKLLKNATLKVYEGGPHGFFGPWGERLNEDLLAFIKD